MPFNADTYRANKYRRSALENLAQAREIKERADRGEAYSWELPRIAHFVKVARIEMHMSLGAKKIALRKRAISP